MTIEIFKIERVKVWAIPAAKSCFVISLENLEKLFKGSTKVQTFQDLRGLSLNLLTSNFQIILKFVKEPIRVQNERKANET